jgi:hypothetical protein
MDSTLRLYSQCIIVSLTDYLILIHLFKDVKPYQLLSHTLLLFFALKIYVIMYSKTKINQLSLEAHKIGVRLPAYKHLARIFQIGTRPENDKYLNQKIVLSNAIALLLAVLDIPFIIFSLAYFPPVLAVVCSIFHFTGFGIIFLNYKGFTLLSRLVLCMGFTTIATIYHSYTLPADHHLVAPMYAIQIIFWLSPWLVFDLREKFWLFLCVAHYIVISLALPYWNNLFEVGFDFDLAKEGVIAQTMIVIAIIGISGGLFIMKFINYKAEVTNEGLIKEISKQQEYLAQVNNKLNESEGIMKKSIQKLQTKELQLKEKNETLEMQQHEILTPNEELIQ